MKVTFKNFVLTIFSAGLLTIYGCGGGGSTTTGGGTSGTSAPVISGTVATGAAVEGALVQITDSSGNNACANAAGTPAAVTATSAGAYSCDLLTSAAAPYVIVAIDPAGLRAPMVSMVRNRPAAGGSSVANVTPLTTAIAAMLAPNNDPLALVPQEGDSAATKAQRAADLGTAATNLEAQNASIVVQLTPLLTSLGIDPATFNPISTSFAPRTTAGGVGDPIDKLLDVVKVDFSAGVPTIGTAFNSPVQVSAPSVVSPPTVSTSSAAVAFSAAELDFARTALQACFALPPASRVPTGTSIITVGGATRTAVVSPVASACQGFVVDDAPPAVRGADSFLTSGSPASVYFRNVLLDPAMTGAQFNIVDVMRVFPSTANDGKDRAVVNIKWVDNLGNPGNFILVAKKYPGSRASGSQWWLYGNQRTINAYIQPWNTRTVQTNANYNPSGNSISQYASGLLIYVDRDRNNPNASNLTSAVVKGPGLPPAGLVLEQPLGLSTSSGMSIRRKDGVPLTGVTSTSNNTLASSNGNLYRLQGTAGLSGPARYSLAAFASSSIDCTAISSFSCTNFVHPTDFGLSPSAGYVFDVTAIPAWSTYTFALYYNNATVPSTTFTSSIVTGIATAPAVSTQVWQDLNATTLSLLDPTAVTSGAATSFNFGWSNKLLGDRVSSVAAYSSGPNANNFSIAKGIYTAQLNAPVGVPFTAITPAAGFRSFQLRFIRTDGVYKDSFTRHN